MGFNLKKADEFPHQKNKDYYFLYFDDEYVGKCIIKTKTNIASVEYITIDEKYRGNNYSAILWELIEKKLVDEKINQAILIPEKDISKYGKLINIYDSWGFKQRKKRTQRVWWFFLKAHKRAERNIIEKNRNKTIQHVYYKIKNSSIGNFFFSINKKS